MSVSNGKFYVFATQMIEFIREYILNKAIDVFFSENYTINIIDAKSGNDAKSGAFLSL